MSVTPRTRGAALTRAPHSYAVRHVVLPIQRFLGTEISSGVVLLFFAAAALVWANSPWQASYERVWHTTASFRLGTFSISHDLREWINDALMVVFFFVVGLEIKREFKHGHLAGRKAAALPVAAALGGMVVPALIFLLLNRSGAGAHGWGIPMATDIAFALGVLALAGDRVPASARIFLLALATVDDIGAIAVIAIAYSGTISIGSGLAAAFLVALILGMQRFGVYNLLYYVPVGLMFWFAVLHSGVHATIAGVILGLLTPTVAVFPASTFADKAGAALALFKQAEANRDRDTAEATLGQLDELTTGTESAADRLIRILHPWSSFVILPLFALANAGIDVSSRNAARAIASPVALGVICGLFFGKAAGISLFSWIALRLRLASPIAGLRGLHLAAIAILGGIGFTVSLFISDLAFTDPVLTLEAKVGVLAGSLAAAVAGFLLLRFAPRPAENI